MRWKILVVDDEPHIREVIRFALEKAGMEVWCAEDGKEALNVFEKKSPSLMVLDIMMPETDGLEVCREVRRKSEIPILFLSSRDEEVDRIVGLEIGGDDYVTKPFSPRELVARVNTILKRAYKSHSGSTEVKELSKGDVSIDVEGHAACWKGETVPLSAIEFAILRTLLTYPEKVYSRDNLIDSVYSNEVYISDRTIDSHIRRIRSKFAERGAESVIETVRGVGYKAGSCL